MNKNKTNLSVINAAGIRVNSSIVVGESGSYSSGDILDANATEKIVTDKVNAVVGNANELLDTLEEIGGALPTKVSQLSNDSNFVSADQLSIYLTQHQDISGKEDKISIEAPVDSTNPTDPITTLTCAVNKYYRIAVPVETLAVTLPTITDTTKIHTVVLYLTGGANPNVTIASASNGVEVYYRTGFLIDTDKTYEVFCLWNGVAWIVSDFEIEIPSQL